MLHGKNWHLFIPNCIIVLVLCLNTAGAQVTGFDSTLKQIQLITSDTARLRQLVDLLKATPNVSPRQNVKLGIALLPVATSLKVDTAIMYANAALAQGYVRLNEFPDALKNYLAELAIAEKINDYEEQGFAYQSIAWLYKNTGETFKAPADFVKAHEYIDKGLAVCRKHNILLRELKLLNVQGVIYDLEKKHTQAIAQYQQAIAKCGGAKNISLRFNLYMNMGISLKNNKQYDEALATYKHCLVVADTLKSDYDKAMVSDNMANLYYEMGQLQFSENMALDVIEQSYIINEDRVRLDMYGLLEKLYEKTGNYKGAFTYSEKLTAIKDSIFDKDKSAQLKDMQEKYDTDLKDKQITSQKDQIDYDKNLNLILGGSGIAVLLVAGFIYYNLRKTAKLNRMVSLQRDELAKQSTALSVMMKELHHRVKNNLQIVSSLLNLQSLRLTDEEAIGAVTESKQRVQAMSLIHQRLYKTDDITRINMKDYIQELADSLAVAYGYGPDNFTLELDVDKEWTDIDKALPLGLILNEILTNAFKYAFTGSAVRPALQISFKHDNGNITLTVKDNGKGINPGEWDAKRNTSFGRQLVKALCSQLRAKETLEVAGGTSFTFIIPDIAA